VESRVVKERERERERDTFVSLLSKTYVL